MTLTTTTAVRPADALGDLARAVATAKTGDPLAPVTVVAPTNTCGVMARRALGRRGGVVAVDMVTLNRLAELIAGPSLAAVGRAPMSSSVVDLAMARVLELHPGSFRAVASHPTTVVALRTLHDELRLAGNEVVARLTGTSSRAQEAVRISRAVTAALEADWYDEADLFIEATRRVSGGLVEGLSPTVLYLPDDLPPLAAAFVDAIAAHVSVEVIRADLDDHGTTRDDVSIVSTTDADEEVRHAVRAVLDAARLGTPFERIAVLWPAQQPYARLVEHHLTVAGIRWNGRPGTANVERLVPRLVLDLLDLDRRGLRRHALFSLVADVPPVGDDGAYLPTASWERASRQAGVARDDDWNVRLGPLTTSERWGPSASSLLDFVGSLRTSLGHPADKRPWSEWADWCGEQLERWLGRARLDHLPEAEYRAWEALAAALDRLRHLDPISEPVTRHRFRAALESELDAVPGRVGRVGDGVTVGSLASAVGLDVDIAIVLGAAEGTLPPRPTSDPLLSDAERAEAGLVLSEQRAIEMHRALRFVAGTAAVTFTVPRGDLRATAHLQPSHWLDPWSSAAAHVIVASHSAGLADTSFPASPGEHRLRSRYAHVRAGGTLDDACRTDRVLGRALALSTGRRGEALSVYDGDLSAAAPPAIDGPISPSRLEAWTACPHAYFVRYLLGVTPIDEPADQISITAMDIGNTQHHALDRFHRAVIAGELAQPTVDGWTDEHRVALMRFFDDECAIAQRRGRTGRLAYWSDERERMRADLLGWLERDSARSVARGSTVIASEHRFGRRDDADAAPVTIAVPDGRTVELFGSVDRIDRTAGGGVVVTDHKTGKATKYRDLGPDDPTLGGRVFQLPAYAAAARALVGDPRVSVETEYSLLGKGDYSRVGYEMTTEVDDRVAAALDRVVRGIESGYFPNLPERPGWHLFTSCFYCEPDELGTAERWPEWLRKRHDPRLAEWFGVDPGDNTEGGNDD